MSFRSIKCRNKRIANPMFAFTSALLIAAPFSETRAETELSGFIENATYVRDGVGISKFRNTGQLEFHNQFLRMGNGPISA